ncbi:MFS transporter [Rubritalea profundi]|uniref:Major facilitator superfamily (MFS) profile domain-containing protein n=1 Tax=Rubritalea profundi TaxID=1658618 RepID=A0A2S7U3L8_9BACT|nr:MFS transporter [Rubritalea profundi]PQJ29609.1 hypothetical protein BSZ32_14665 [Rubritalea profundi]
MDKTLSNKERSIIFWGSFLALMAAGVGFGIRVMSIGIWQTEFNISGAEAGGLFGASLWPIAVGMILFSLVVDKIGYKSSMMIAFAALAGSSIWSIYAKDLGTLTLAFLLCGFGHGVVEACINPLCATMYKDQKSKMLNILHASWPAGIAVGATIFLLLGTGEAPVLAWRQMFWFMIIPVIAFGVMFLISHHYPKDERVEANVSYVDMFKEFGGLGIFLATTFLFYELVGQMINYGLIETSDALGPNRIYTSVIVGAAAGLISGFALKSAGKVLFFILCLIMIPLATAEIATDGWIQKLMKPVLAEEYGFDSGWAIVMSSLIMMTLRFFAGVPLRFMSPPALLLLSSVFSIAGLLLLSEVSGIMIFIAFIFYGVGQTFYWPTVLGFTAEQFPKGGAMTLNTVSAMGLLTVGIFGMPFLGAVADNFNAEIVKQEKPQVYEVQKSPANFFFWKYEKVDIAGVQKDLNFPEKAADQTADQQAFTKKVDQNGRKVLKVAAYLPAIMGVAFLIMIFFYKSRGGYKPVVLESSWE